jgi:hypothetical protein
MSSIFQRPTKETKSKIDILSFRENSTSVEDLDTKYPIAIGFEEIDKAIYNWFSDKELMIDSEKLRVVYLTTEKWAEYKNNWDKMNRERNLSFPYVTIVRENIQPSTMANNIPNKKFLTYKEKISENGGKTYKYYVMPQPARVKIDYRFDFLSHYMEDMNKINEKIVKHFASLQSYISVHDHFMPMVITSIEDNSNYDEPNTEKIINVTYIVTLDGYLIDPDDFEEKIGTVDFVVNIVEDLG